jgi:diadenosine tetraphosphate (Ap4A) HIT family hydrolase
MSAMDSIVLEANGSGRMWAEDLDGWMRLLTSDGCPVCQDAERVGTVAESDHVWVNIWPEAVLPGYVCILSKQHVIEPFDLSEADQAHFFLDCMAVARGVASVIEPAKMNYEIHGNTVPHLHMHLFPRTPADVYVGFPNHCRTTFQRSTEDIARLSASVRNALADRQVG